MIKILYAPYNIASMPAITLDEINGREGFRGRGICIDYNQGIYFGKYPDVVWKKFLVDSNRMNLLLYTINLMRAELALIYYIFWADIIIWQWDIKKYLPHYWLIKLLRKKIYVEWLGSDIRKPIYLKAINKYYKNVLESGEYPYKMESDKRSENIQSKFQSLFAIPILAPEMLLYLEKSKFNNYYILFQRFQVDDIAPNYPSVSAKIPKICHAPSKTGAKGTEQIRLIIERLKQKYEFNYVELIGLPRYKVLEEISDCDIFLDQFILGAYGMATMEALSYGKPVFCYLLPEVKALLPDECPIVSNGLDFLEDELERFILNPELRNKVGKLSRLYVEENHSVSKLVDYLIQDIFKQNY